jgi:hypothetical protein
MRSIRRSGGFRIGAIFVRCCPLLRGKRPASMLFCAALVEPHGGDRPGEQPPQLAGGMMKSAATTVLTERLR